MRRRARRQGDGNIEPVAGDEPSRGRDDHGKRWIACGRSREQYAQRIALVEMG